MKRIDWHSVFEDFAYLGLTGDALAERVGLRTALLQSVAAGHARPNAGAANRIALLWCSLTSKSAEFLPTTQRHEAIGLASSEEAPPNYAELEAMVMSWAQILRK